MHLISTVTVVCTGARAIVYFDLRIIFLLIKLLNLTYIYALWYSRIIISMFTHSFAEFAEFWATCHAIATCIGIKGGMLDSRLGQRTVYNYTTKMMLQYI